MKYQLVIFDFDGTLADSFPWFLGVFNTIADRYGFKRVEAHESAALRGLSARQIIQHLGVPRWKLPLIARHARSLARRDRAQIALFAGVDQMLQQLAQAGITLAVVSTNSEETVRHVLGPENAARITSYRCAMSLFGKQAHVRRVLRRRAQRGPGPMDFPRASAAPHNNCAQELGCRHGKAADTRGRVVPLPRERAYRAAQSSIAPSRKGRRMAGARRTSEARAGGAAYGPQQAWWLEHRASWIAPWSAEPFFPLPPAINHSFTDL